jgi:exoribonuclease-2
MKDGLVRADTVPLVLRATGTENLMRGTRVRVRITGSDLLTLDLWGALVARLDEAAAGAVGAVTEEGDEDEGEPTAGPLALAIDLAEPGSSSDGPAQDTGAGASNPAAAHAG